MSLWPTSEGTQKTSFGGLSRSQLMSRIRSRGNATTELRFVALLRKAAITGWRRNYALTEKPDFVFVRARLAVFVDGCFWHGHGCGRNLTPRTNTALWSAKIALNRARDTRSVHSLRRRGWRVMRVWECCLRNHPDAVLRRLRKHLAQANDSTPVVSP
jgi:DNA mismatch endonuclease, patch repair protein